MKYTVLSVTNVLRSFSIVLDKCQPLLSGKHHCAGLNSSLSVSLSSIRMMYVFLHEHSCFLIVTSSFLLSLSRAQTLFFHCCRHPSLSPDCPLHAPFIYVLSRGSLSFHCSPSTRVYLFVMLLGPSTSIFYQFIFSHLCFHLVPLLINVLSDNGSI